MRPEVRTFVIVACLVAPAAAMAQWSTDPGANLAIGDRTGIQNQAKIVSRADSASWISWFDNSAGGYKPTLQLLSADGVEQFAHNGITLANTTNSSTVDYDLKVDGGGNALVTFMDNSSGTSQVTAMKISVDGTRLWGAAGVQLPSSTGASNPKIAALADGTVMVGWSVSGGITLRHLASNGGLLDANFAIAEAGRSVTLSDLQASSDGHVIALWVRPFTTSFLSSKYLYTQKFTPSGAAQWTATPGFAAVCVYGPPQGGAYPNVQGGSIQNGYFPVCFPDATGGAAYAWYENAGPRNAFVQRVTGGGALLFALHGLPIAAVEAGRLRLSAGASFDKVTRTMIVAATESNTNQNQFGLMVQKISDETGLEWGVSGTRLMDLNANQSSFARALALPSVNGLATGGVVACFDARSATTGVVPTWGLNPDGSFIWGGTNAPASLCTVVSGKARLDAVMGPDRTARFVWADSRNEATTGQDIVAQNINADGTLGMPPAPCRVDVDHDGIVSPDDLADYITAFFSIPPADGSDFDGNGIVDPDDLADFIAAFFAGC